MPLCSFLFLNNGHGGVVGYPYPSSGSSKRPYCWAVGLMQILAATNFHIIPITDFLFAGKPLPSPFFCLLKLCCSSLGLESATFFDSILMQPQQPTSPIGFSFLTTIFVLSILFIAFSLLSLNMLQIFNFVKVIEEINNVNHIKRQSRIPRVLQ
ncbi:hypothetical protein ACB094_12G113800 [Castanea mollissima]